MKVAWVSTWERICGIADYSKELWPIVLKSLEGRGDEGVLISLDKFKTEDALTEELKSLNPDVIHFQHEYSFFGGKNPPYYSFPHLADRLRREIPHTQLLATAHTVIPENYKFPLLGKVWQMPLRALANIFLIKNLRKLWGNRTWGAIHGTIIHSRKQLETVKKAGAPFTEVVPHFVPVREKVPAANQKTKRMVLVFGFFNYDKGQDLAIEAFQYLNDLPQVQLLLAGGVRQEADQVYVNECKEKIRKLKLSNRVEMIGYISGVELQKCFEKTDLVVAPFRVTSGSGSLAQGLARGLPVLASDLKLNLEINEREPETLEYFKSHDPKDLARKIRELIFDQDKLNLMRQGALRYAVSASPNRIALQHLMVYDSLVK